MPVAQQRWPDRPEYVVLDRMPERVAAALAVLGTPVDAESRVVAMLVANEARTGQETDVYRRQRQRRGLWHRAERSARRALSGSGGPTPGVQPNLPRSAS